MKVSVNYGKCSIFVQGMDMNCPLCKALVRSGESHECAQGGSAKSPRKKRKVMFIGRRVEQGEEKS